MYWGRYGNCINYRAHLINNTMDRFDKKVIIITGGADGRGNDKRNEGGNEGE